MVGVRGQRPHGAGDLGAYDARVLTFHRQDWGGKFDLGDRVAKTGGDYKFAGEVVTVFAKASGAVRLVVENADGLLFIFNEGQLEPAAFGVTHLERLANESAEQRL